MQIELIDISLLKPYGRNARVHSQKQVEQIAKSIKEFGFTNPILVSDDLEIIGGHGRFEAAKLLGLQEVPHVKLSHLNDKQIKAYRIADNSIALNSTWDTALLESELDNLRELGVDIEVLALPEFDSSTFDPDLPDEDDRLPSVVKYELRISFDNEDAQQALFVELRDRGFRVKA